MIFHRALKREMMHSLAGILTALFAILLSTQLVRLLGQAAAGRVAPEAVAALLGFTSLGYLPTLLSLSIFLAVLLTLARSYRDSEMLVWMSSGLPLTAWIRPVMGFALPFVVLIAVTAFFLAPWAVSRSDAYREQVSARSEANQASPGMFREASSGQRVVFVEDVSEQSGAVKNVFVSMVKDGKHGVVMAERGYPRVEANGDRFMILENGRRYEVVPGELKHRVVEFERFAFRIEEREVRDVEKTPRNQTLVELVQDGRPKAYGELAYRIATPLSALILALLAIPLSFVNPRAGRSANLIFAVLIFAIYKNMTSISQAWIAQGKVSFFMGWWLPHASALLVLLILLVWRMGGSSLFRRRGA